MGVGTPPSNPFVILTSTTTSAGAADGSSIVDASLIGLAAGSFDGMAIIIHPGDEANVAISNITTAGYNPTTGEIVVAPPFKGGQVASGVKYEIVTLAPGETLMLKLKRSSQSGSVTLTGSYATIYQDSNTSPWLFAGATIDLTNMAAGDTVWVRISSIIKSGGNFIVKQEDSYSGVQPSGQKSIDIGPFANVYGVLIEAYQSAGAPPYLALDCEFMVAKR
jgi:hypothetical protein